MCGSRLAAEAGPHPLPRSVTRSPESRDLGWHFVCKSAYKAYRIAPYNIGPATCHGIPPKSRPGHLVWSRTAGGGHMFGSARLARIWGWPHVWIGAVVRRLKRRVGKARALCPQKDTQQRSLLKESYMMPSCARYVLDSLRRRPKSPPPIPPLLSMSVSGHRFG